MHIPPATRALAALVLALTLGLGAFGTANAAVPGPGTARDDSAACIECHDDEDLPDMSRSGHGPGVTKPPMAAAAQALATRPMGDAVDARTPTCITCHGPSPTHVKKPEGVKDRPAPDRAFGRKTRLAADGRNQVCQDCHQADSRRHLWRGSAHEAADVACNSCHKVHTNSDRSLAKATQAEVCYACHKAQRAQMNKPSHHPVPEGTMTCADCHNVHGSAGPKLARRDSTNATCYACHAEKRGPFVHQHEPVADDCTTCHNAHGSTVAAMLVARPPMLCQQCHTPHVAGGIGALGGQPGVFGAPAPGQTAPLVTATTGGKNVVTMWQGRSCMNCHTQVHGSNNPSNSNAAPRLLQR